MAMESTPDSGVEIKNEAVAPRLAPCFLSDAAAGSTPQEQRGIGTPNNEAFITDITRPLPRCFATDDGLINTFSRPPINIPNNI